MVFLQYKHGKLAVQQEHDTKRDKKNIFKA